ncbi:MAG: oligosaccharide flippase family protein [Candidatus Thermoplasmatota archaeon]|nr:oligosaccharide flippase family protein [Candidatus Thermoplasmatota archaeon]
MPDEGNREAPANQRLMSPKAALSVATGIIGAVLSTAALVFIAQNMGPTALGILGYAMAAIGLLSFLSDFGVGSVHSNFIRRGEDLGKCVGAYALIKLVLLVIFSLVTYAMISLWSQHRLGGMMPGTDPVVDSLSAFLIYYILLGISQIATHTFDAQDAVAKAHIPALLELVVRVSFVIYVATSSFKGSPEGPALLAASYVTGVIASALLVALLMVRVRISRPDRETLMKYIRSLAPVFVVSMIIILDLYLDKVIVGHFWGAQEVGLYFGVQRMAVFVGVFSLSVATLILPSVTAYFTRKDIAASWDIVNQAERYVSLIVIPTAAFYLTFGSQILGVFLTSEFADEVRTMDLLVIAGTVVALVLPLRSAIAGVGKPATLFYIGVGGLCVQLAAMLVLVPGSLFGVEMLGLGAFGAGASLLIASVYYFFVLRYMAWRIAKIVPNSRSFRHLLCALLMVGVMYTFDWLVIPANELFGLILLALIGTVTYGVSAYVLGELEASDYRYFRSMLNPQDTIQYAVNELLGKRGQ